ncbi:transposase [Streptomyces sp. NPDC047043]|uniref:transposase n=1 Tax=Streptomyces sp. NPDC047043 TaxID=3154497 RepID=UPI0034029E22
MGEFLRRCSGSAARRVDRIPHFGLVGLLGFRGGLLTAVVGQFDARITALLAHLSMDQGVDPRDTIPGIGRAAADVIIAETGGGMTRFATAGHSASRIGACPGMNASAGVSTPGRTRSPDLGADYFIRPIKAF